MKKSSKPIRHFVWIILSILLVVAGLAVISNTLSSPFASKYEGGASRNIFGDNLSYSKSYFVNPRGDDNNDGKTVQTPMFSIDKALSFAAAGDTVELADGAYLQTVSSVKNGLKESPIVIRGSRKAIIYGTDYEGRIVEIKHDFIILDGFTIDGKSGDGSKRDNFRDKLIYAIGTQHKDGVEGLIVRNMLIQNAGGECIRLRYYSVNNEIHNSTIRNCGIYDFRFKNGGKNGEGIYIGTAPEQRKDGKNPTDDPDESNSNYIYDNMIETYGNECVDIKESASKNIVERNTCQFQQDANSAGFDARGSYNTFRNNTSKNNLGTGFRLGGDTETDGIHNEVYGNVIMNNKAGAIKIQRMPQGKVCENTIFNNNNQENNTSQHVKQVGSCR